MPGMRLDFLKNPSQRVATGKSLPLKQVEAIILYGRADVKAKVIQKILPTVYGLSLNSSTHHVLLTLLDHSDNLVRVQMLYHIRRKILDLCTSPAGNVVLQRLVEKLPVRQRREVTEVFTLNAEQDEFRRICTHPFGNHVAQQLMRYAECASVVEGVFLPYLSELAVDSFGMRVVVKYVEEVEEGWVKTLGGLVPGIAWEKIARGEDTLEDEDEVASEAIDRGLQRLFDAATDSMVISALFRHALVPMPVKDAICAHLCEFAWDYLHPSEASVKSKKEEEFELPEFTNKLSRKGGKGDANGAGEGPPAARHTHTFVAVFEHGDAAQREALWASICSQPKPKERRRENEEKECDLLEWIVGQRETAQVVVAALKSHEGSRAALWRALLRRCADGAIDSDNKDKEKEESLVVVELAQDPVRSVILRAFIDVEPAQLGKKERQLLYSKSLELSQNPVSSPVLQRLVEVDGAEGEAAGAIRVAIRDDIASLIHQLPACYLFQSLLQFAAQDLRESMIREDFLPVFIENLREMLAYVPASRVMQKLLAYATDEVVVEVVNRLISDAEAADPEPAKEEAKEEPQQQKLSPKAQRALNRSRHYDIRSSAIISYALHQHACYVIRSLLQETRSRQLDGERKLLMNELKPHVFDLAVSPWAGRIVLDAMLEAGSEQLSKAIKNVVFLKAEAWLSEVSEEHKKKGSGVDPTIRSILKEQRKRVREGEGSAVASNNESSPPRKKSRPLHRTLKK